MLEDLDLRSESVQEVLNRPPSWMIRWGITVIFIVMLIILVASWIVKYPEFIPAQILISTQNPPEKIEAKTNGRLIDMKVKNQQEVSPNQILAAIESNANINDVLYLKSIVDTFQPSLKNINFPFNKTQNLSLGELQTSFIQFEKAWTQYNLQQKLQPYAVETIAGEQTLSQQNLQIQNLNNQRNIELSKLSLAQQDFNRNQKLYNEGVISKVELEQKKLVLLQAEQAVQNINLSISQQKSSMTSTQKTIRGSSISQQKDETNFLSEVLQSYDQLKKDLKAWEQTYLLTSSIMGKVSFQQYWGENQFIKQGEVIFIVLPTAKESLLGKAVITSQNSGKIKPNQKVIIKLDNYPYQQYGVIYGKVQSISLAPNQEGNYYVEISLPEGLKTSYNKQIPFDKEMRGTAEIVTEDLRLIERFFYQFRSIFKNN